MALHRRLLHNQFAGDLGVRAPARDQAQHVEFPRGQLLELVRRRAGQARCRSEAEDGAKAAFLYREE